MGGNPDERGSRAIFGDPHRAALADEHAEQAVATWQGADRGPLLRSQATGMEFDDAALGVGDAERRVAGSEHLTGQIGDPLKHAAQGALGGQ